jgi:hypothetical protein
MLHFLVVHGNGNPSEAEVTMSASVLNKQSWAGNKDLSSAWVWHGDKKFHYKVLVMYSVKSTVLITELLIMQFSLGDKTV